MTGQQTVHIVDDDDDARESAALLLEASGFHVARYPSGADFLAELDPTAPACILLDIHMPRMDGLEVQRQLRARGVNLPVIVLTGQGNTTIAIQAMKNGAFEFLEKPYRSDVLLQAVADAFLKLEAVTEDLALATLARDGLAKLTARETEVLRGLIAGLPNKLIAHELDISVRTVEIYRANVMKKLEVRGLAGAVRIALAGRVEPLVTGPGR